MFIDLIPEGVENAISRADLVAITGLNDRDVRQKIEDLRKEGYFICNREDGRGYFISHDINELTMQYRKDTARAMAILNRRKPIRDYLKERGVDV